MMFKLIKNPLLLGFIISINVSAQEPETFLPAAFDGNKIIDSISVYPGNMLYDYIDGGAEIFMEYGFQKVAMAQYSFPSRQQIQTEVFKMSDAAAAFGAFSFYINSGAKSINIGSDGTLNSYYLAFWINNFLVVLTSNIKTDSAMDRLVSFGKAIEKNMPNGTEKPKIILKLLQSKISDNYLKYIRGTVGLSNFYNIAPGDAFQFNEAAAFEFNGCKVLLIHKENEVDAKKCEESAYQKMIEVNKTTQFQKLSDGYEYIDYRGTHIHCQFYKNYVIVLFNSTKSKTTELLSSLLKKLDL